MISKIGAAKLLFILSVLMMVNGDGDREKNKCFVNRTRPTRRNLTDVEGNVIPIKLEMTTSLTQRILSQAMYIYLDKILGYNNIEFGHNQWQFDINGTLSRIKNKQTTISMEVWAVPNTFPGEPEYIHTKSHGRRGFIHWFISSIFSMYNHWTMFKNKKFGQLFANDPETMSIITNYTIHTELTPNGTYVPQRCRKEHTLCTIMLTNDIRMMDAIEQIDEMELYIKLYCVGENLGRVMSLLHQHNSSMFIIFRYWLPSEVLQVLRHYSTIDRPRDRFRWEEDFHIYPVWWAELESIAPLISHFINNTNLFQLYDPSSSIWEKTFISEYGLACMLLESNINQGATIAVSLWDEIPFLDSASLNRVIDIFQKAVSEENFIKFRTQTEEFVVLYESDKEDEMIFDKYPGLIGMIGPAWAPLIQRDGEQLDWTEAIVISYSPDEKYWDDWNRYTYFFKIFGANNLSHYIYSSFMDHFDWRRVVILSEEESIKTITNFKSELALQNINVVSNLIIPKEGGVTMKKKILSELMKLKVKIIIVDVSLDSTYYDLICAAFHLKMTAKQGYVWFLAESLPADWWQLHDVTNSTCTSDDLFKVINGHFRLQRTHFGPDDQIMQENISIGQWRKRYESLYDDEPLAQYAGFLYDACWTYFYALKRFLNESLNTLDTIHTTGALRFKEIIAETDFYGLSGRVRFNAGPTRVMDFKIEQFVNKTYRTVANFYPNASKIGDSIKGGKFIVNNSAIEWLFGSIPSDGRESPPQCVFPALITALHVSCEIAIVIEFLIILISLGILCIVGYVILKRRYDKKVRLQQELIRCQGELLSYGSDNLAKWEIPRNQIVLNRKIGEGAFGLVYSGDALLSDQDWCPVAVKTLKIGSSIEDKCDFLSEVEMMKRFEHPNIIKLLGMCLRCEPVLTIMELMFYGDLRTYLLTRKHLVKDQGYETSDEVGYQRLTMMALDVARALSHLHHLKYIHRDVASRNCLVNTARTVKLGDFGMSRSMYDNDYYRMCRKGKFPIRWMAPESLSSGFYSPSTDVWSFGILLYEIITFGNTPYGGMANEQVMEYVKSCQTLSIPNTVKPTLTNLMESCWRTDATKRPMALDITTVLAENPLLVEPCLDVPSSMSTAQLGFDLNGDHLHNAVAHQ